MAFTTKQHVTDWVAEHPDGVTQLRWALAIGTFQGTNASMAQAWLLEHDFVERVRHEAEMRETAKTAAAAAVWSSRAATLAGVIATAALFVSAWPYIRG